VSESNTLLNIQNGRGIGREVVRLGLGIVIDGTGLSFNSIKEKDYMNAIFKYELSVKKKQVIELPKGAIIIRIEDIDGKFYLWAIVNTYEDCETESRHLECYKTGQPIDDIQTLHYIGLAKLFIMQELGLYFFERK